MKTAITELLNIDYPIIQGAMAWVADPDLASAVSNAGGLGVIGTGHDTVDIVQGKVEAIESMTDKPFAVNVMFLNPNVDQIVDYVVNSGVKIITTGAGTPKKYMPKFIEQDIKLIPVVASVAQARMMERMGASAVIVEGMEAGGHIGRTTTLALLAQVTKKVDIPVIAAGGFGDGRGLAAALMLGASGIQVGTRFVVANESNAHDNFKNAILKANDIDTVVTGQITGHPVRVLRNQLTNDYLKVEKELTGQASNDFSRLEAMAKGALRRAVVEGDTDAGSMMAGQIAGLIDQRQSVQEIILDYVNGARAAYQNAAELFND